MTTFLKKDGAILGLGGKLLKKVAATTPYMPRYMEVLKDADGNNLVDDTGNVIVTRKFYTYSDDTVQSMLTPAAYSAGTYPYGWCVTDSGNTYQVNNYSGTSEAVAHADWDDLGAGAYFVPVATHQDLNDVRAAITKTWGGVVGVDPFAGTYVGQGVAGNYIQVSDIDLYAATRTGGAYDNAGAGWLPIGTGLTAGTSMSKKYDGGGHIINGLYINRSVDYSSLFGGSNPDSLICNLNVNGISVSSNRASLIIGFKRGNIKDCISSGVVFGGAGRTGGIVAFSPVGDITIINCMSSASVYGLERVGGIIGQIEGGNQMYNCLAIGKVIASSFVGSVWGVGWSPDRTLTIKRCYGNSETSHLMISGINGGTNAVFDFENNEIKTTAELLAGIPSAGIYTDWDTRIWSFVPNRYPIHKFFGELPMNIPPPTNLQTAISGSDIVLTWDDYTGAPKPLGYFVYVSKDNSAWEKINATKTTDKTLTYTPTGAGSYNFFVTAVYFRRFEGETGNSVTTLQAIT